MSDIGIPPAISTLFSVIIDGVALGTWNKMSGLGMTIATQDRSDSAMTFFQHHLPGALTYSDLVLERLVNNFTATTMTWFSTYHMLPVPLTASITAMTSNGTPVMAWELLGVTPFQWKGPSFDASNPQPGTETLVIKHMGFA
jgi:phage tail-like protein